jgi:excisionase family DNA binding protein
MSAVPSSPSPWLTAEEAAPLLSTTAHNLRRLARLGRSPMLTRRVGSRWLFSRADLSRFLGPGPDRGGQPVPDPPPIATAAAPRRARRRTAGPPPPQTLPGFEVHPPDPTTQGRTCITYAAPHPRPGRS